MNISLGKPDANTSMISCSLVIYVADHKTKIECNKSGKSGTQCMIEDLKSVLMITRRGETTHSGVDVNNTHPSMINPDYNMILANLTLNYQYFAY